MMRLVGVVMLVVTGGNVLSQDSSSLYVTRKVEVFYNTTGEKKLEAKLEITPNKETGFVKISESVTGVTSIVFKGKLKSDVAVRKDDTSLTWIFPEITGKVQISYACTIKDTTVKISGKWITEKNPVCGLCIVSADTTLAYTPKLDQFVAIATKNRQRAEKQQKLWEQQEREKKIREENERLKKEQDEKDKLAREEKARLAAEEKAKLQREKEERDRLAREEKDRKTKEEQARKIKEQQDKMEAQYKAAIEKADSYYSSANYTTAYDYYARAASFKPMEQYPRDRMELCRQQKRTVNSETPKTVTALNPDCVYRVQISASATVQNKDQMLRKLPIGSEVYEEQIDQWYKYTTGCFTTAQEAVAHMATLESMGFKKPFMVKYVNGVRFK